MYVYINITMKSGSQTCFCRINKQISFYCGEKVQYSTRLRISQIPRPPEKLSGLVGIR